MSLAEELLADLNSAEMEEGDDFRQLEEVGGIEGGLGGTMINGDLIGGDGLQAAAAAGTASVRAIAKLRDGPNLSDVMKKIAYFTAEGKREKINGAVEADPEYELIVRANNLTVDIDNEINVIHKFTRDLYSKRFPELESLVPASMDYIKTVLALGNNILERSKSNDLLSPFLTPATIMIVSVTASTTQGSPLDPYELDRLNEACDMVIDLQEAKFKILTYVESRMSLVAPNLSIIVGASTAAKLMGHAGGLGGLLRMPACNIQVLGSQKKTLSGFSTLATQPHTGYIFYSDLIQKLPPDLRKKAARLVAAKVALATRVDFRRSSPDGKTGEDLLSEIDKKFEKWQEPPPVKQVKPLPAPLDPPAKKRGGRRYRKMKERLGISDLRRTANRLQFGEVEDDAYQADLGFTLGSLGKKGVAGRLRAPVSDAKTKARVSKVLQQKLAKSQASSQSVIYGGSTTVKRQVAGTASSVAFTPLQGLEIVNPLAKERVDDSKKYFACTAKFVNVQQKARSHPN